MPSFSLPTCIVAAVSHADSTYTKERNLKAFADLVLMVAKVLNVLLRRARRHWKSKPAYSFFLFQEEQFG